MKQSWLKRPHISHRIPKAPLKLMLSTRGFNNLSTSCSLASVKKMADDGKNSGTRCKLLHEWWIILSRDTLDYRLRYTFRDQIWLSHGYHICTRKNVDHSLGRPILRKMGGGVGLFSEGLILNILQSIMFIYPIALTVFSHSNLLYFR